ncbi:MULTISPECIES: DUF2171 domain-containing protein [Sphingomonas]|uniref:SWFGD domain-containing protein n=1 Tax=Sphingomonas bisphenolicum TaxID=296544 RepID=A0ABN5WBA4_9SPHN|nr:DUF2171 domain-containing protein [Sphingomonas bisphenolicum]BBF69544.1 hypothetical protein SBA_ch1_17440 [Sphingomonas bisphenolicum]
MGYQGGRRYGGEDRYGSNWDRGGDRYRRPGDYGRDDRGYRYGTRGQFGGPDYRRPPSDYDPEDRGFFDRAGDEVRSWFGDEEAERRREYDEYYNRPYGDPRDQSSRLGYASAARSDYLPNRGFAPYSGERSGYGNEDHGNRVYGYGPQQDYGAHHDSNYQAWRQQRVDELDRDYAEYQREHRDRFNSEFGSWRTRRGEQRQAISQVREHHEVVGSDGEHVGTVDKLRGDRIILTKSDSDAGGVHHSVPSSWIKSVDATKVTLEKTAEQAQHAWRTEREQNALFGDRDRDQDGWSSGSASSGSGSSSGSSSASYSGTRYR